MYKSLEQARKIFEYDPKKEVQLVKESIKNRHIQNVEEATTLLQLTNLLKNHIRLVNFDDEHRSESWRQDLITRIREKMKTIQPPKNFPILSTLSTKQWYGYDAYDGAFHYFYLNWDKLIFIDSFSDCSSIFKVEDNAAKEIEVAWIRDPEQFSSVALQYLTVEQYQTFWEGTATEDDFFEVSFEFGKRLFDPAFENDWEREMKAVFGES